ncbi:MAG: winged helix-turn-helix domain-containing protein [Bryobacterales bacterium]|nr:winged helix-turn-helix domain-containing protein [Bryobacterales bacterium]
MPTKTVSADPAQWTYLTNHAHVLILLARDPNATMREVAEMVGITERAVQRIVAELEDSGVLTRSRIGRRNVYQVDATLSLRHAVESHRTVADLLRLVGNPLEARKGKSVAS